MIHSSLLISSLMVVSFWCPFVVSAMMHCRHNLVTHEQFKLFQFSLLVAIHLPSSIDDVISSISAHGH